MTRVDPFIVLALRKVSRGEIGATNPESALRHRVEDLSPDVFAALHTLRRRDLVRLTTAQPDRSGWITAELSSTGRKLLEAMNANASVQARAGQPARQGV